MDKNISRITAQPLIGKEKAAAFLLALPNEQVQKIFNELDEIEIVEISHAMSKLGSIGANTMETIFEEFVHKVGSGASMIGTISTTESMLNKVFDKHKVEKIMAEIRGPLGSTMWDKLNNVDEKALSSYLKNEHPQTIAVILSKISPESSAKVLSFLPKELAVDVMDRMINADNIQSNVLHNIEETLKSEFISNFARSEQQDPHEKLAEIFNHFDSETEGVLLSLLDDSNHESAERIKELMFTFNDLVFLDPAGVQTLLRSIDKNNLSLALKGANEELKDLFFKNMSERAGKLMLEDMEVLGMVRLREVENAQNKILQQAKQLIESEDITIVKGGNNEQLIA